LHLTASNLVQVIARIEEASLQSKLASTAFNKQDPENYRSIMPERHFRRFQGIGLRPEMAADWLRARVAGAALLCKNLACGPVARLRKNTFIDKTQFNQ
jgi:hypothetical protein